MKTTENQRFKAVREKLLLTQAELSKSLEVSNSTIAKAEALAELNNKLLNKLSATFNVNIDWVKYGKGEIFKSGTLQENIAHAAAIVANNTTSANPWQDEAYKLITDERNNLREQVGKLTQALLNLSIGKPNFLRATDVLRVAA